MLIGCKESNQTNKIILKVSTLSLSYSAPLLNLTFCSILFETKIWLKNACHNRNSEGLEQNAPDQSLHWLPNLVPKHGSREKFVSGNLFDQQVSFKEIYII